MSARKGRRGGGPAPMEGAGLSPAEQDFIDALRDAMRANPEMVELRRRCAALEEAVQEVLGRPLNLSLH